MKSGVIAIVAVLLGGCPGDDDPQERCVIDGAPTVEIGVPDSLFQNFSPLADGGDIPLSSTGQEFLAVQLAIRATNLDPFGNIEMTVTYTPDVGPPVTAVRDSSVTERLFCRDLPGGIQELFLVPVVVSSEDLGNDIEIQNQSVDVEITITDESGRTVSGTASGVLRRI